MNVYDLHRMTDLLTRDGAAELAAPEDADLIILNTCHIREKAAEKVYSELGRLRLLKVQAERAGRKLVVAVAGCVAQAEGEEIIRRAPVVDLVVGPQAYHRLPALLARVAAGAKGGRYRFRGRGQIRPAAVRNGRRDPRPRGDGVCHRSGRLRQVLHFLRRALYPRRRNIALRDRYRLRGRAAGAGGRPRNHPDRPERQCLPRRGSRAAGDAGPAAVPLGRNPGLARLRYTTSHPCDMGDDLIAAHRDLGVLMPQLHLPVQSGSDKILAAMNRRHTRADYLGAIARLRAARPDMAFTSDFIVGFPGETEDDFRDTVGVVDAVGFAGAFSFKYSPRPGTPAAARDHQIPEAEKNERLARLQDCIDRNQTTFNRRCVGRSVDVLFEKPGRLPGQVAGRSPYLQPVQVMAPSSLIGDIATVRIIRAGSNSLFGALCSAEMAEPASTGTGG